MKYTFISVPALGDKQNTYLNIKGKLTEYAQVYKMNIPDFKVRFCTVPLA
jgi:V-type H+-transporting ATPase subunit C